MSDDKKPVDLAAVRTLADRLDVYDMPGTAKMMRALADEKEALRDALKEVLCQWICSSDTRARLEKLIPDSQGVCVGCGAHIPIDDNECSTDEHGSDLACGKCLPPPTS